MKPFTVCYTYRVPGHFGGTLPGYARVLANTAEQAWTWANDTMGDPFVVFEGHPETPVNERELKVWRID